MILLLLSLAFAEPQTKMKRRADTTFDGRLLNDEAVVNILSQCGNVDQAVRSENDLDWH